MFSLTETRVKMTNKDKIQKKFGRSWNWSDNYHHHPKGRILFAWKENMVHVKIISSSNQFIHNLITYKYS